MNLDGLVDSAAVPHDTQPGMQCSGFVYLGLETGHLEVSASSSHWLFLEDISVMKEHQYRLDVKSVHVAPDIVNLGTG